jgi:hypothetical protein
MVFYGESFKQPSTHADRVSLEGRLFAIKKTAHRLQEQAGEADLESERSGQSADKRLRFIEQGCISVDAVLTALTNYLATDDQNLSELGS